MILFRRPDAAAGQSVIALLGHGEPTFREPGWTAGPPAQRGQPATFHIDSYEILLGRGAATFARAREALQLWRMFPDAWTEIPLRPPIADGTPVAVGIRAYGLWHLFCSRIVYAWHKENEHRALYGFAYVTLPGHPEIGEERFLVEWDRADDTVTYSILAISRPGAWFARLGYPFVRRLQRRFGRDSLRAMRAAVEQPDEIRQERET